MLFNFPSTRRFYFNDILSNTLENGEYELDKNFDR